MHPATLILFSMAPASFIVDDHYQKTPLNPRSKAQALDEAVEFVLVANQQLPKSEFLTGFDENEVLFGQIGLGHRYESCSSL